MDESMGGSVCISAGKEGGKAKPLKKPKSGPKEYDDSDLEFLKKKKVGINAGLGVRKLCSRPITI